MSPFSYKDGMLYAEDVALPAIAKAVGTPSYVYSNAAVCTQYSEFSKAFEDIGLNAQIFFAVKVNGNLAILRTLSDLGAGADVVSLGELLMARKAGIPAQKIVFAGVGKSAEEIRVALDEDILQFNVESIPELHLIFKNWPAPKTNGRVLRFGLIPILMPGPIVIFQPGSMRINLAFRLKKRLIFTLWRTVCPFIDPVAVCGAYWLPDYRSCAVPGRLYPAC